MNTYEITFTRENGSTGKDRITAANEKQARKDFREIYRHSSATITDVIVAAENVPASKQQERDALDQIRAIVDTLGEVRHMKQGISIERTYDLHDRLIVRILKRRGRLTLEEVSDLLRLEGGGEWSGWYAVLLNCTEGTIGGNGLYDSDDPKGDAVDLYEINEGDDCPICGKFIPPFQYCPSCGAKWSDADQNVETLLASMMEETRRMIATSSKEDSRVAWYWSFIGSLDMTRQLGLITEERRQELYEKAKEMKP